MALTPLPTITTTPRYVTADLVSQATVSITFPIFGDGTDLLVSLDGVKQTSGWELKSSGGSLATRPRPITDGYVEFSAAKTAKVEVWGRYVPRRVTNLTESAGPAVRDFNYEALLDKSLASELFERFGRTFEFPAGTSGLQHLGASALAGNIIAFDEDGNVVLASRNGEVGDGEITNAKLANMAEATFKMRAYGAGTGAPIDGTVAQARTALGLVDYNVESYGAIANSIGAAAANQTAIQACIDAVMTAGGGRVIFPGSGTYYHSAELSCKILPATNIGSGVTWGELNVIPNQHTVEFCAPGSATLRLTTAATSQLRFVFNGGLNNVAPFYSKVIGLIFNGGGVATYNMYSEWMFHAIYEDVKFYNATQGFGKEGYGNHHFKYCQFVKHTTCINMVGGGDDTIYGCGFWPNANGQAILFSTLSGYQGNTVIIANIFNRDTSWQTGTISAIKIDGTPDNTKTARDIKIIGNEFHGYDYPILINGYSAGDRNIYQIEITGNHQTYSSIISSIGGPLVHCSKAYGINVHNNFVGSSIGPDMTGYGMLFYDCDGIACQGNVFERTAGGALFAQNVRGSVFNDNIFRNIGTSGTGNVIFEMNGASCTGNSVAGNVINQDSASYGQYFVTETGGANGNTIGLTTLRNCANLFSVIGSTTSSVYRCVSNAAALANGLNSNIASGFTDYLRITGPTGAFSVEGFTNGSNGRRLRVHNTTGHQMTIVYQGASSTAVNRINTLTGGNVVLRSGESFASFTYDATASLWILDSSN